MKEEQIPRSVGRGIHREARPQLQPTAYSVSPLPDSAEQGLPDGDGRARPDSFGQIRKLA